MTTVMTWLAVLAVSQPAPSDVSYINQREFKIPIVQPNPAKRAEIDQLLLFVSTDEGKTWQQTAVAAPDQDAFPYFAAGDGTYWFNVAVKDKQGRLDPPDVSAIPPAQKLVVDTRKPLVKLLGAERQADQASIAWEIHEENPDLSSFKLEYRTPESQSWYMVPVTPATANGQKRWSVTAPGALAVRLQVQDAAGNMGIKQTEIAAASGGQGTLRAGFTPPTPGTSPPAAPAAPAAQSPNGAPPQPTVDSQFPTHTWQAQPGRQPATVPINATVAPEPTRSEIVPTIPSTPPPDAGPRPIASSDNGASALRNQRPPAGANPVAAAPGAEPPPAQPRGQPPGLQFVNTPRISLAYEITKLGPSGPGVVELWITQDDGRTWRYFAKDNDVEPPFELDLPGEGLYGLALIVRSKAAVENKIPLGKQSPLPGEAPEVRVEVDTTAPDAKLWTPKADPRSRDRLTLLWTAEDRNLAANPVTLSWSDRAGGQWQPIAADLPNTGKHVWQMPANTPYRVYLRLEVKDLAGNVAVAETQEPVLVDLSEPEGRLTGVSAAPKR